MQAIKPRFEFRAFAQNFGLVEDKLRRLSGLEKFRESFEIYILSAGNKKNNIKIRYNTLDIKVFVKNVKGLEQWNPHIKADFPIHADMIGDKVFPALGMAVPELNRSEYTEKQFLDDLIAPHPELALARVFKHRFGYLINSCLSEIANLLINGAAIKTVAVESTDVEAVLKSKELLGLQEYENVNYLLAIKRILGMEPIKLQSDV